jgi:hypothetical protein
MYKNFKIILKNGQKFSGYWAIILKGKYYAGAFAVASKNDIKKPALKVILFQNSSFNGDILEASFTNVVLPKFEEVEEKATTDIYGTGELIITKFSFLDENLEERFIFTIDEPIIFRVNFKCFEEVYKPIFVVAIYKPDGTTITQLIDKQRGFGIDKIFNNSFVDFKIDNLKIGKGEYLVSVAVFHDIDLTNPIEQKTYCLHDRKYKFKIEQPYGLNMDLGMIYQDFEVKYGSEYE